VGTRVWQHLLAHRRLKRVCEETRKEYDVDESTLREDILQLVDALFEAGIVITDRAGVGLGAGRRAVRRGVGVLCMANLEAACTLLRHALTRDVARYDLASLNPAFPAYVRTRYHPR
jgi:Coenzyme PQQ synthesis protein D (PqqD)